MKAKYWVHYVEGCSPKTKSFKDEKGVQRFIDGFVKKYGSLDDGGDNWVEKDKVYYGYKVKLELKVKAGGKSDRG